MLEMIPQKLRELEIEMEGVDEKLQVARHLIAEGNYASARALLQGLWQAIKIKDGEKRRRRRSVVGAEKGLV